MVTPTLNKIDVKGLKNDIANKYSNVLPASAVGVWKKWIEAVQCLCTVPENPPNLLLELGDAEKVSPTSCSPSAPPEDLLQVRERETAPIREIYCGRYRRPEETSSRPDTVENVSTLLTEGKMAAVALVQYPGQPFIGEVLSVGEETFQFNFWKGTYGGKWQPDFFRRQRGETDRRPWTQDLPKTCVVCCNFELTDNNKLRVGMKNYLRQAYEEIVSAAPERSLDNR